MPGAIASLAKELLEQEATGDRARAENWFKKYAVMPPEVDRGAQKELPIFPWTWIRTSISTLPLK